MDDREIWVARCAAQYEKRGGLHLKPARQLAEIAFECDEDLVPEVAADMDMDCWDDVA